MIKKKKAVAKGTVVDDIKKGGLPALNDEELRQSQAQRFSEGMGALGDYAKDLRKITKVNHWFSLIVTLMILFVVGGSFLASGFASGGLDGIWDVDGATRRFNCSSGTVNDVVRTYDDATDFVELFGGDCLVYHKTKDSEVLYDDE